MRTTLIAALTLLSTAALAQVHPYSYWQPTATGFVDMAGGQNMGTYGSPQLVQAPVPDGYALTSDGSIQFGNLHYKGITPGKDLSVMVWTLDNQITGNNVHFVLEGGNYFHHMLTYDNNSNFTGEVSFNGKNNGVQLTGQVDIQLGPDPFRSYYRGGVFGPQPTLNQWHQDILIWKQSTQMVTMYHDGALVASVYLPYPNCGKMNSLYAMVGNFYDHDPANSVLGLVGPIALSQQAWTASDVDWLWANGAGRQFMEYN
jgi:hypothetical protein